MRCHNKVQLLGVMNTHLISYPTPMNLNYSWNGGSLAGLMLVSQMLTGILLAMHYVGHVDYAFASVQHIMTDVPSGMILRYAHANGASLFFIVVYLHILRGLYYGSGAQPREMVWATGVVILLVMIITAFIGYVLPWGQQSFWGATVITSLASAIPVVGKHIMYWLWGGFSVDNPTLNRFYSFHYTLPFILAGLSVFHIAALHQYGSTNPLGVNAQSSTLAFGSYFGVKDLLGVLFLGLLFSFLVFFAPDLLGHPDNMIPANPYSTPQHIVPEWYVCWTYAILRSIPNKAGGVAAIGLVFVALFALPFISLNGGKFKVLTEWFWWVVVADLCLLSWVGMQPISPITALVGQSSTFYLFAYLLILLPLVGYLEARMSEPRFTSSIPTITSCVVPAWRQSAGRALNRVGSLPAPGRAVSVLASLSPTQGAGLVSAGGGLYCRHYGGRVFTELIDASLLVNPTREARFKQPYEVADCDNRVLAAQKLLCPRNVKQAVKLFHWSTVSDVDRVVASLITDCARQHTLLNKSHLSDTAKRSYGQPLTLIRPDGTAETVWVPIILYQVLSGLIFSDGYLREQKSRSSWFELGMGGSPLARDLVVLTAALLEVCQLGTGYISQSMYWSGATQKVYWSHRCISISSPVFDVLESLWYRPHNCGEIFLGAKAGAQRGKVLHPQNFGDLNSLAICYAYLGDGNLKDKNQMLITTLGYPVKGLSDFLDYVNNLMGIKGTFRKDDPTLRQALNLPPRYSLYFGAKQSTKFSDCIAPYMPQSGFYKLPKNYPRPIIDPPVSGAIVMDTVNRVWRT